MKFIVNTISLIFLMGFASENAVSKELTYLQFQAEIEKDFNNTKNCLDSLYSPVCDHSLLGDEVKYYKKDEEKRIVRAANRAAIKEQFDELRRTKPELDLDKVDLDAGKGICRRTSVVFPSEIEGYAGEVILLRDHSAWEIISAEGESDFGLSSDLCMKKGVASLYGLYQSDNKLEIKQLGWRLFDKATIKGKTLSFVGVNQILDLTSQNSYRLLNIIGGGGFTWQSNKGVSVDLESKQCLVFEISFEKKYRILLDGESDQFLAKKIR